MSILIPIQPIPNQSFSIQLDGNQFDITIRVAVNIMAADIIINNISIELGARIVAGYPLINYFYLQQGNLLLLTQNDEYPYYTEFGNTQTLVYLTIAEIQELNATT
jgi:hypothetical protein